MERSALGMLYREKIEFTLPERDPDDIRRSRRKTKMDGQFSVSRNRDLAILARATGARRKDLRRLKPEHFEEVGGRLYVNFYKSKGGRSRLSPVLPSLERDVRKILDKAKAESREHERFFDRIHSKADIHGFRREYAQALHKAVSARPEATR